MSQRRLKVVLWQARHLEADHIIEDYIARVSRVFEGHDVRIIGGPDNQIDSLEDVEVLVSWGIPRDVFLRAKSLEWIQFGSAGINHTLFTELLQSNVRLTTQKGVFSKPMAEHGLAMALHFCRRFDIYVRQQAHGKWARGIEGGPGVREIEGSTCGVIGMGHIGCEVAAKFRALGARIIATRSKHSTEDMADKWVDKTDIPPLLRQSDWVVIAVPHTPSNIHLIGQEQLDAIKCDGILINLSRGTVVDENALVDALSRDSIGGAGLDVFEQEPLPESSPLWGLPNVLITPHVSGTTPYYGVRGAATVHANLRAFLAGEPMPTEFDRAKGY